MLSNYFGSKTTSIENIYFTHSSTFIWLWNLDVETKRQRLAVETHSKLVFQYRLTVKMVYLMNMNHDCKICNSCNSTFIVLLYVICFISVKCWWHSIWIKPWNCEMCVFSLCLCILIIQYWTSHPMVTLSDTMIDFFHVYTNKTRTHITPNIMVGKTAQNVKTWILKNHDWQETAVHRSINCQSWSSGLWSCNIL
jgi:hypothetical protein